VLVRAGGSSGWCAQENPKRAAARPGPQTVSAHCSRWGICAAKIERDVIAHGVFTSVPELKRKQLMRYIRKYNEQPKPVK
jgi:hypothetical protein